MQTPRKINLLDATMLIIGSMIGSGIFIVSADMARQLESPLLLMLAWGLSALITVFGALSYGELAAAMPKAGGQYVYLREAFGSLFGFLYGWSLFTVIQTGTIAAVAVAFAKFTGVFVPFFSQDHTLFSLGNWHFNTQQLLAITMIWLLSAYNFRDIKSGAFLQNLFTFSKVLALLLMLGAGVWLLLVQPQKAVDINWSWGPLSGSAFLGAMCLALVGSLFSSDAWNNVTFTGAEIEKPGRNLPLALLSGTLTVTMLYVFINFIYLKVIPFEAIQQAENDRVGTLLMQMLFGDTGLLLMAAVVMISTFGCLNGIILSAARVYYAMAKDQLFFPQAAQLNKSGSPAAALIFQAVWASLLTLSGTYGELLNYVMFAVILFYVLTVAGLFVLRRTQPEMERPYKAWGYPVVPLVYILLASAFCLGLIITKPADTVPGLLLVLLGIPVFYLLRRFFHRNKAV